MSKVNRAFTLPDSAIAMLDGFGIARSAVLTLAIRKAGENPQSLIEALQRRMVNDPKEGEDSDNNSESTRIGLSFDEGVLNTLKGLTARIQLPIEHVLRLVIEAYIHKHK